MSNNPYIGCDYSSSEMAKLNAKSITFIAIMAALGNILSMVSSQVGGFAPNIP